jgi:hypothetical protein
MFWESEFKIGGNDWRMLEDTCALIWRQKIDFLINRQFLTSHRSNFEIYLSSTMIIAGKIDSIKPVCEEWRGQGRRRGNMKA